MLESALPEKVHHRLARQRLGRLAGALRRRCDRLFDLEDGAISVEEVDDEYSLSDNMPGCSIELVRVKPQSRVQLDVKDAGVATAPFIEKKIRWKFDQGEWRSLYTYDHQQREPKKYWVLVFQDPEQRESELAKTRKRMEENVEQAPNEERVEGCSCLYGNPCTELNKYNCKDWKNRFAVARANS